MKSSVEKLDKRYYGSKPGKDGTALFNELVQRRLRGGDLRILDIGAGAGRGYSHDFRGRGARLVGLDIDPEVLDHPYLDEAHCSDAAHMPFPDEGFDLAFSDFVFEHLPEPEAVIKEVYRVLKPGGWFILRTPNRWHYVPVIAKLLPEGLHSKVLSFSERQDEDVYPKYYRCNSERAVRRVFDKVGFVTKEIMMVEQAPGYLSFSTLSFLAGVLYERTVNRTNLLRGLRCNILAEFQKPVTGA